MPLLLQDMHLQYTHGGGRPWHHTFRLTQDWFRKYLTDFDFWYVYHGEAYLRDANNHTHTLRQGTSLLMKPGSIFDVWQKPGSDFATRYFHFKLFDKQQQPVPPDAVDLPLINDMAAYPHFDTLTHRMNNLIALDQQTVAPELSIQSRQTISAMLKSLLMDYHLATRMKLVYTLNGVEDSHYNIAMNLLSQVHENPAGFDLDAYTHQMEYSADHLRRIVKRAVGRTPHQLIIEAKIKRAQLLLHESDITVSDIADQLGYANVHYFSLQFKQIAGVSPSQYRQKKQKQSPSAPGN